jgi:hypothetical protein
VGKISRKLNENFPEVLSTLIIPRDPAGGAKKIRAWRACTLCIKLIIISAVA